MSARGYHRSLTSTRRQQASGNITPGRRISAPLPFQAGDPVPLVVDDLGRVRRVKAKPLRGRFASLETPFLGDHLSLSNAFIGVASWFVRIFFILIDCLPVLVKFISGSTPYDRLVDTETASA